MDINNNRVGRGFSGGNCETSCLGAARGGGLIYPPSGPCEPHPDSVGSCPPGKRCRDGSCEDDPDKPPCDDYNTKDDGYDDGSY